MVSDRDDRFSVIAFSKDFGNTWELRYAWVISEANAEAYNKNIDPEDGNPLPYMKKESWVFGNTYWEECFLPQTLEQSVVLPSRVGLYPQTIPLPRTYRGRIDPVPCSTKQEASSWVLVSPKYSSS
jgi:hypothetical protein